MLHTHLNLRDSAIQVLLHLFLYLCNLPLPQRVIAHCTTADLGGRNKINVKLTVKQLSQFIACVAVVVMFLTRVSCMASSSLRALISCSYCFIRSWEEMGGRLRRKEGEQRS